MTQQIAKSVSFAWLNLDAWSELYGGLHWIVVDELPEHQYETASRHGPLSKLVLLGSHNLVELMLFHCVRQILNIHSGKFPDLESKYDRAQFYAVFSKWPEKLLGSPFECQSEPFKSALLLAKRRNATIHKESAMTTLGMARSALYTAVHASAQIEKHFFASKAFKYAAALQKYPLPVAQWFSEVKIVDRQFPPMR